MQENLKFLQSSLGRAVGRLTTTAVLLTALGGLMAEDVTAGNTASMTVYYAVEEIAVLEVSGPLSSPVALIAPEGKDATPMSIRNTRTYVRFTSVVPDGKTRSLTASLSGGTIPSGCVLKLEVVDLSGTGECGVPVPGGVSLAITPQAVVTGIGNCCTGTGRTDGAQISYMLVVEDPTCLVAGETTMLVTLFTLTDAS